MASLGDHDERYSPQQAFNSALHQIPEIFVAAKDRSTAREHRWVLQRLGKHESVLVQAARPPLQARAQKNPRRRYQSFQADFADHWTNEDNVGFGQRGSQNLCLTQNPRSAAPVAVAFFKAASLPRTTHLPLHPPPR